MRLILGALLAVVTLISVGSTERSVLVASSGGYEYPPITCSEPCVVKFSPGGIIDLFEAQGRQLAADKTKVIIDGVCLSACTILVDIARDSVCLTKNALLGYHKDSRGGDIHYTTPGLNEYIQSRGGLPEQNSGHLLMLNFSEAEQFYRPCRT